MQIGDILLTSGIDGVFPPGVMTGVVHQIDRNPGSPFPRVLVKPAGGIDRSRIVLIVGPERLENGNLEGDLPASKDRRSEVDKVRDKAAEKGKEKSKEKAR